MVTAWLNECYPAVLQRMLGDGYIVSNFGVNATCVRRNSSFPYSTTEECLIVVESSADFIIIELGANDIGYLGKNEKDFDEEFVRDYTDLINGVSADVRIFLTSLTPIYDIAGLSLQALDYRYERVQSLIKETARENRLPLIDLFSPLKDKHSLFPDGIHPNAEGARIIAEAVYHALEMADAAYTDI